MAHVLTALLLPCIAVAWVAVRAGDFAGATILDPRRGLPFPDGIIRGPHSLKLGVVTGAVLANGHDLKRLLAFTTVSALAAP